MKNFYTEYEKLRLKPNHQVSQWYMYINDVKKQVDFLYKTISAKRLCFLGDGDGISILLALKIFKEKTSPIKEIVVFDIDQRELNLYKSLAKENKINQIVKFKTVQYNISDKILSSYKNYFDYFYINPPYSYVTNPKGLGFMLWLDRCIEMTKSKAGGCIVYPISHPGNNNEVSMVKENLQKYLKDNNFNIKSRPKILHRYAESECISKNLIVERTRLSKSHYEDREIPYSIIKSLYSRTNKPPHLILDDGSDFGKQEDFKV